MCPQRCRWRIEAMYWPTAAWLPKAPAGCCWTISGSPRRISDRMSRSPALRAKGPARRRCEERDVTDLSTVTGNVLDTSLHAADADALKRMHAVRPVWRGIALARDV